MNEYIEVGQRIYEHRDRSDFSRQRFVVFCMRAFLHGAEVRELQRFFQSDASLAALEQGNAIFYEQLTRHVFYHQSTVRERLALLKQHFAFCTAVFAPDALQKIYYDGRISLWEAPYGDALLSLGLAFKYVDRKEGLLTIDLQLAGKRVYHITFSFCRAENQLLAIRIGALQGSYGGQELIHGLTKYCFGYRPKNLILFALRLLAQGLAVRRIYAVSNRGFFTNTHVRLDKKLKASLDDFWQEVGGRQMQDVRFFELPVAETRKQLEEVKSQKRNLYRKRYIFLDEIEAQFKKNLPGYLK